MTRLKLSVLAIFAMLAHGCSNGSTPVSVNAQAKDRASTQSSAKKIPDVSTLDLSKIKVNPLFFDNPAQAAAAQAIYVEQFNRPEDPRTIAADKRHGVVSDSDCTYGGVTASRHTKLQPFMSYPPCGQTDPSDDLDSYIDWAAGGEDGVALIGDTAGTVGIHQDVDGVPCNGSSYTVGDDIGAQNGKPNTIVDINVIAEVVSMPFNENGVSTVSTIVLGWVYKDNKGGYWSQEDMATHNSWSAGVSAYFVSIGMGSAATGVPHYEGTSPPKTETNVALQKCFKTGSTFG